MAKEFPKLWLTRLCPRPTTGQLNFAANDAFLHRISPIEADLAERARPPWPFPVPPPCPTAEADWLARRSPIGWRLGGLRLRVGVSGATSAS